MTFIVSAIVNDGILILADSRVNNGTQYCDIEQKVLSSKSLGVVIAYEGNATIGSTIGRPPAQQFCTRYILEQYIVWLENKYKAGFADQRFSAHNILIDLISNGGFLDTPPWKPYKKEFMEQVRLYAGGYGTNKLPYLCKWDHKIYQSTKKLIEATRLVMYASDEGYIQHSKAFKDNLSGRLDLVDSEYVLPALITDYVKSLPPTDQPRARIKIGGPTDWVKIKMKPADIAPKLFHNIHNTKVLCKEKAELTTRPEIKWYG